MPPESLQRFVSVSLDLERLQHKVCVHSDPSGAAKLDKGARPQVDFLPNLEATQGSTATFESLDSRCVALHVFQPVEIAPTCHAASCYTSKSRDYNPNILI
jgi:hypothetical protein